MKNDNLIFYWKNGKLLCYNPFSKLVTENVRNEKKAITKIITKDFIKNSTPNKGKIEFAPDFDYAAHKSEIETAYWLIKNFGGNIYLNQEDDSPGHSGKSNPDYVWNGKWWDLKEPTSKNALDKRIQDGMHQICENKEYSVGGIIADIRQANIEPKEAIKIISNRLERSYKEDIKVILKDGKKLIEILETEK